MSAYERPQFLVEAIDSVMCQTWTAWELIVVDDHSQTDPGPLVRASGDERVRYIRQNANRGIASNVTTGMRAARGEFITNVHDDDLIDPTYVARLVAALTAHPDCAVAFCDHRIIDAHGIVDEVATLRRSRRELRSHLNPGVHRPFVEPALLTNTVFLGLGCMWRNGLVNWDDVERSGDHWDNYTLYELCSTGAGAVYVPDALASWREHEGSNTMASAGRHSQETKLRTGQSRVYCYSAYRRDPRLAAYRRRFNREIAAGHASVAIAHLRTGELGPARIAAVRSLIVFPGLRAAVALVGSALPYPIRTRIARLERPS